YFVIGDRWALEMDSAGAQETRRQHTLRAIELRLACARRQSEGQTMARFSIVPYTLRILNRDPDNAGYIRLSDWNGVDFLDVIADFVDSGPVGDDEAQKLLAYRDFNRHDRLIEGIV